MFARVSIHVLQVKVLEGGVEQVSGKVGLAYISQDKGGLEIRPSPCDADFIYTVIFTRRVEDSSKRLAYCTLTCRGAVYR